MRKILTLCFLVSAFAATSHATTITFVTPTGASTGGGPVNASATFTTSAGQISITLSDLLANPTDVGQLVSDLDFVLSNGATAGTLSSSSGQQISVVSNGSFTLGPTTSTGWGLNQNVSGGLQLDALGFVGPAGLIIGSPGPGNVYGGANSSIAGNGPHNPFINQTATFTVTNGTITADTTITSATFSFGTVDGINVPGVPSITVTATPEPNSLVLLGSGIIGLAVWAKKRTRG